ncbi:T9SS type A sorting domain-containing protein [Chryseobacterium sp. c4a]|uniref:T9SS type A sorting domain-containing protein n=1 Tax=Chryseobacterium sp. c4a TaxID=1573582 RepID=UPI0013599EA1|nr:T9SS type A sorting domain-containing protein [Chryseobacterium sp. c4a]
MKNKLLIFFLLLNIWVFAQEDKGGRPLFYDYLNSGINGLVININESYITPADLLKELKPIIKTLNNEAEIRNLEAYIKEYPQVNYLKFYGKKIEIKKDFKLESTKFKLEDKFICLLKIRSENAYSLQTFFSKFNMPEGAKFFLYNSDGMILGSFNSKNIINSKESENVFVTQPIQGSEIYLELDLENESDLAKIDIQVNTIMHGFSNLYESDGPFSESEASIYTSCNKNVSCVDGSLLNGNSYNSTINKGNIKSVGLVVNTNAIYGFTCSGTLINNTKQDGAPYFLTAEHCVKGTPQKPVFLNESIVIFNHETKLCNDAGSTVGGNISSPSTNSVSGMQVLTSMGITKYPDETYSGLSQDFALVKLNTTAEVLKKYKVCYSGWSTAQFPNNIDYSFTAHHPSGVVKKISIANQSYITPTNYSAVYDSSNTESPNVYFSKSFSTNLSQGYFLAVEFANGFPYYGSSGASLFTRDGFILGTLSSGPIYEISNETPTKPINLLQDKFKACGSTITNKAKYNVLFSRFWRDYIFMQPWLNPDSQNVQSIGNYCPAGIGNWGSVNIENPQEGCNPLYVRDLYYSPDYLEATIKDLNQYRVRPFSTYGKKIYVKNDFIPAVGDTEINEPKMSNKLLCLGIDKTCQGYSYLNHSYRIGNNFVKKIKAKDIIMTNQFSIGGSFPGVESSLINVDEDRVAVLLRQRKTVSSSIYDKFEVNIYKYNEINNEYDTESVIDVFPNALELQQTFPYYEENGIKVFFEKNTILILVPYAYVKRIGLIKIYRENENSPWVKQVFPLIYEGGFNEHYNHGIAFYKKDLLLIQAGTFGNLAFNIKSAAAGSPQLLFVRKTPADMLVPVNMTYQGDNTYEIFGHKTPNQIDVWRFNLSTQSLSKYTTIHLDGSRTGFKNIYVNRNTMIVAENRNLNGPDFPLDIRNKRTLYYKEGNQWNHGGVSYTTIVKTNPLFKNELIALNDSFFLDDIEWRYLSGGTTGYKTRLFLAYNLINAEHLKKIFGEPFSGAYMNLDKIERDEWFAGQEGLTKKYDNTIQTGRLLKVVTADTYDGVGTSIMNGLINMDYRNPKTYILSHLTAPLVGNKKVKLEAEHSVVIKPGFEVSSNNGTELYVKTTSSESFPESLTYDDMLHPVLSDYHDKASKKMANPSLKEEASYGEIILNGTLSTQEVIIDKNVRLYPNPTKDILNIDFNGKRFKTVEVYSIDGKKLITQEISSMNNVEVNLLRYPPGIYMVTLIDSNGKTYPNKVIKK